MPQETLQELSELLKHDITEDGLIESPKARYNPNQGGLFDGSQEGEGKDGSKIPNGAVRPEKGRGNTRRREPVSALQFYTPTSGKLPLVESAKVGTWQASRNKINTPKDATVFETIHLTIKICN